MMRKRILALTLLLFALFSMTFAVFAEPRVSSRTEPLLVDYAGLLSEESAAATEALLEQYSDVILADIVVVTVLSTDGADITTYADDFYDYNGYGFGDAHDGILLLLAMDEQDLWISASGEVMDTLTDQDISSIIDGITPDLSNGQYDAAFSAFANMVAALMNAKANGTSQSEAVYTTTAEKEKTFFSVKRLSVCVILGFLIAFLIMKGVAGSLKTVRAKQDAQSYVRSGSMILRGSSDRFLYTNVVRTAKPKQNASSGSTTTHTGSSGTTHGGGGGHF